MSRDDHLRAPLALCVCGVDLSDHNTTGHPFSGAGTRYRCGKPVGDGICPRPREHDGDCGPLDAAAEATLPAVHPWASQVSVWPDRDDPRDVSDYADWQYLVSNGDTVASFRAWQRAKGESDG